MSTITRQLVAIDILSEEIAEHLEQDNIASDEGVNGSYGKLLSQFSNQLDKLCDLCGSITENDFSSLMANSQSCHHVKNKQMLRIHARLLKFVLEFYAADTKANALLFSEFGDKADERLSLLQTKAIKARSQYKTVAKALGPIDYQAFVRHAGLLSAHWGWKELRL